MGRTRSTGWLRCAHAFRADGASTARSGRSVRLYPVLPPSSRATPTGSTPTSREDTVEAVGRAHEPLADRTVVDVGAGPPAFPRVAAAEVLGLHRGGRRPVGAARGGRYRAAAGAGRAAAAARAGSPTASIAEQRHGARRGAGGPGCGDAARGAARWPGRGLRTTSWAWPWGGRETWPWLRTGSAVTARARRYTPAARPPRRRTGYGETLHPTRVYGQGCAGRAPEEDALAGRTGRAAVPPRLGPGSVTDVPGLREVASLEPAAPAQGADRRTPSAGSALGSLAALLLVWRGRLGGARRAHLGGHQERPLRRALGAPAVAGRPPLGPAGHLGVSCRTRGTATSSRWARSSGWSGEVVPVWVTPQRLWRGLLLAGRACYERPTRCSPALRAGGPAARVPRCARLHAAPAERLSRPSVGLSSEALPVLLAPAILLPVVLGHPGPARAAAGRRAVRRRGAVLRRGEQAARPCLAAVPAGLWLLTRRPVVALARRPGGGAGGDGRRARVVAAARWSCWAGGWPPFLDWIEAQCRTSSARSTCWTWLARHDALAGVRRPPSGGGWWPAGYAVATGRGCSSPPTAMLAGAALAGTRAGVGSPSERFLLADPGRSGGLLLLVRGPRRAGLVTAGAGGAGAPRRAAGGVHGTSAKADPLVAATAGGGAGCTRFDRLRAKPRPVAAFGIRCRRRLGGIALVVVLDLAVSPGLSGAIAPHRRLLRHQPVGEGRGGVASPTAGRRTAARWSSRRRGLRRARLGPRRWTSRSARCPSAD